jgi:SAM-dependent methyltransferase
METRGGLEVPRRFMRSGVDDEAWEVESAAWLIEFMCRQVGLSDLRDTELLDMGCGVKLTRLFVNDRVPIKRYVGVDVYREMIEFLQENVDDPRFEYVHVNVKNELYNPEGDPFSPDLRLPVGERQFDLICLFSVFTHLPPDDYRTMLTVLRPYLRPDGRLFFSLFIDQLTEDGHGLMDSWSTLLKADSQVLESIPDALDADGRRRIEKFRELDPTRPGLFAVYSEEYARELIEETGWAVVKMSPPNRYIQHSFVCQPA